MSLCICVHKTGRLQMVPSVGCGVGCYSNCFRLSSGEEKQVGREKERRQSTRGGGERILSVCKSSACKPQLTAFHVLSDVKTLVRKLCAG